MAGSIRDYFIRFLFKTDKQGAQQTESALNNIGAKLDKTGAKAFAFNEKLEAIKHILHPFQQFKELVTHTADEADNLQDLSERTGIATRKLEELGYMAKLSGTELSTMTNGIRLLEKNMGEALHGGKEQIEMFGKLGISMATLRKTKTGDELLPKISKEFEKLKTHAEKTAFAMKIFGRAGQEMLPFLEQGPEAIAAMQKEMELLGGVTSDEFIGASKEYVDNMKKMESVMKGIKQALVLPFIKMFNESNKVMMQWLKTNGEILRSKIGEWAEQLVVSFGNLKKLLIDFAAPLLALAAAFNLPLLAMIGVKAMIALIIDDFAAFRAGNDSVIGHIVNNWDQWLKKIGETQPALAGFLKMAGKGFKGIYSVLLLIESVFKSIFEGNAMKNFEDILTTAAKYYGLGGHKDGVGRVIAKNGINVDDGQPYDDPTAFPGSRVVERNGVAVTNNNDINVKVEVPAGTQIDERKLAQAMKDAWREEMDSELRNGYDSLVPEAY